MTSYDVCSQFTSAPLKKNTDLAVNLIFKLKNIEKGIVGNNKKKDYAV